MSLPPAQRPESNAARRRRAAFGGGPWRAILLMAAVAALGACTSRRGPVISAETVQRDRVARAEIEAAIADDHAALADLIASDRFAELETVYADPELREIALRLARRGRALERLDETNVLPPGAP